MSSTITAKSDLYDYGAQPVDKETYFVCQPSEDNSISLPLGQYVWKEPPETIPVYGHLKRDFTGVRLGRLVVVGFLGSFSLSGKPNHGGRQRAWLMKCDCGNYQLNRERALVNGNISRCYECDYIEHLKWLQTKEAKDLAEKGLLADKTGYRKKPQ